VIGHHATGKHRRELWSETKGNLMSMKRQKVFGEENNGI
jgi:hypothetical protein